MIVLRPFCNMDEDSDEEDAPPLVVEHSWPPTRPVTVTHWLVEESIEPETSIPPPGACFPQKFDFQWRQFPRPQILPELRRESFYQNSGPIVSYADPYEAFTAIWDRPIMEYIAGETNRYAQQEAAAKMLQGITPYSRIAKWKDTSADELYTYFAIILATGIVVKSRLEEYWNASKNIFSTPEFSTAMTYDRFSLLSKCLHFNNNDLCTKETMKNNESKLIKVLPIVQHLNKKFASLYVLGRNIALDESLTQWTGRLNIRQYIPNKAASVGIKTYELCESETGYLWRFEVETRQSSGNAQEMNPISGKIPSLVLRILHGLEHKGHTVWMDNFYNSPALARELKLLGFDCVGTLRTNRQLVPAEITNLKATDMAVGQVCGCTSGDVDIIVWRDKKQIALISTYHGLTTTTCDGITKPAVIHDYNICMGGVDKKDQLLAMYPIERKRTMIWYKKFFRRLLNVSVLNAYIMLTSNRPISHRNFRRSLVVQLLERHNRYTQKVIQYERSELHMPNFFDFERAGAGFTSRRRRRKCALCSKRTISYCGGCAGKPLCVPSCFSQYHTSK